MADHRITDFVDQQAIDRLKELGREMEDVKNTYIDLAKELMKGLSVKVDNIDALDRLTRSLADAQRRASENTDALSRNLNEQNQIVQRTTAVIAEELQARNKVNREIRQSKVDYESVMRTVEKTNNEYEEHIARLIEIEAETKKNRATIQAYQKQIKDTGDTTGKYTAEVIKLTAINRELAVEKGNINQLLKAEEKANASAEGSYDKLSQSLEILKKSYKALSDEERNGEGGKAMLEQINQLDTELKHLAEGMGEHQRNVGDYAIAMQNGAVVTEDLNRVLEINAATVAGCIEQNKELEKAKLNLSTADANYEQNLNNINQKIAENNARISDVSAVMNKSAKSIGEAESQNKLLSEALKLIDVTADGAKYKIDAINKKIAENNRIIQENSTGSQSVKKDLKELVLEIANLTIQYQALNEEEQNSAEGQALASHIQELTERAGALKDAISDTNEAISNAASDTRGFDQLSGAVQLAIDGFGLATGAAEMLGISSEDLASIQTKLQAAIAASNAMQSIQNTLQAQSAVMQGVNLVQTKARVIAENLHTAAQGKGVIATTALTVAQWAFNAAANANPIGLLVVAITAAIAAVYGLIKAFQAFSGPSETAIQNYEKQAQALKYLCKCNDELIESMKARGATDAEITLQALKNKEEEANAANRAYMKALAIYEEDTQEYKDALAARKKADEDYKQEQTNALNFLRKIKAGAEEEEKKQRLGTYEYKRQLIQAELKQQKAILDALKEQGKVSKEMYADLCKSLDKAAKLKTENVNKEEQNSHRSSGGGKTRAQREKEEAEELKKQTQAGENALLNIITSSLARQLQAESLSYKRRLAELQAFLDKELKKKKQNAKMIEAINNQIKGLEAEHNNKVLEIETNTVERRRKAQEDFINSRLSVVEKGSKEELDLRCKLLDLEMANELAAVDKLENEESITVEEAAEMRANISEKYAKKRTDTEVEYSSERIRQIEAEYATKATITDEGYRKNMVALKQRYADELAEAGNNMAAREKAQKKYEQSCAKLTENYAVQKATSVRDMYKAMLADESLTADQRKDLEAKLASAEVDIAEAKADQEIQQGQRVVDAEKQMYDERMAKAQQYLSSVAQGLTEVANLASAIYDAKIQDVEDEQDAQQEAAEAEQDRISELVEKKVITEEEGEARKRAAEAKSARQSEELEKKKQRLQYKQAIWDKANSIAQIGLSTAQAIMAAMTIQPHGIALAAIAAAMGALQLATAIATPIPKYAKGTDFHQGGLAIVGDAGKNEVVYANGDYFLTPDKPTVVDIPRGAVVYPDVEKFSAESGGVVMANTEPRDSFKFSLDFSQLEKKIGENNEVLKLIYLYQKKTAKRSSDHSAAAEYELFKAMRGL